MIFKVFLFVIAIFSIIFSVYMKIYQMKHRELKNRKKYFDYNAIFFLFMGTLIVFLIFFNDISFIFYFITFLYVVVPTVISKKYKIKE